MPSQLLSFKISEAQEEPEIKRFTHEKSCTNTTVIKTASWFLFWICAPHRVMKSTGRSFLSVTPTLWGWTDFSKVKEQSEALYSPNKRPFKVHFPLFISLSGSTVSWPPGFLGSGTAPWTRSFHSIPLLGVRMIVPGSGEHCFTHWAC